mgnify:CR=1 FL=1
MISFLGSSHAAHHLALAAIKRGNEVTFNRSQADVIFVSEDTPTDANGKRDLEPILELIEIAKGLGKPIVLTSQVPPGFTRSQGIKTMYHQAETLRIKDAEERAYSPDYIAVGMEIEGAEMPSAYVKYLYSFDCPVLQMTWEEAEMSKIAVNMMLAAQVEATNRLSEAAKKVGASWQKVSHALALDKRIGKYAYLTPGRWEDSKHLYRDFVTLEAISTS